MKSLLGVTSLPVLQGHRLRSQQALGCHSLKDSHEFIESRARLY